MVISSSVQKNTWIDILYRMLDAYIKSNTENSESLNSHYCFTTEHEGNVKELQHLFQETSYGCSPYMIKMHWKEDGLPDFLQENQMDETVNGKIKYASRDTSTECIIIDDDEPPIKVQRSDTQMIVYTQREQSQNTTMLDDSYSNVSPEDIDKLKALKEKWKNEDEGEINDDIDVFISLSKSQMRRLCQEAALDDLTETSISTACTHVIQKGSMMSDGNCSELLSALLLKKFIELSQSASRILSGVITTAAENFSKPLIDALFVPATRKSCLNTYQADLMVKICKDIFSNSSRVYFLEQIFKQPIEITDNLLAVLQTIFDSKADIENGLISAILETMKEQGGQQDKNLKFGKMILALINKYGRQMTKEHKEILLNISMIHKTFLKKSIQTSITKL